MSINSDDNGNINENRDNVEIVDKNENEDELYAPSVQKLKQTETSTQEELNDLVRDLGLPKDGAEFLASYFKKKNMLSNDAKVSFYRDREKSFRKYFAEENTDDGKLIYCNNIDGLMEELKPGVYKDEEWRLFIDSSKRSLKAVLLHNTNLYA